MTANVQIGVGGDIITLGDGNNDTVSALAESLGSGNKITLGNGAGDTVNASAGPGDTIILGNGAGDTVTANSGGYKITLGNGAGDTVNASGPGETITLGNGNNDTVMISGQLSHYDDTINVGNGNADVVNDYYLTRPNSTIPQNDTITVGNGNDTIYVGNGDTVTVGTGQDSFVFDQTAAGQIGAVTINHFNPSKDVITLSSTLTTAVSYQDNSQGNAVVTVDNNSADTITLVGVHASALHASDFHFA